VVLEQVPDHQDPARAARRVDGPLGVGDRLRERLLDEAVLAGLQHPHAQLGMRRDGCGEHDRVERGVREQVVELAGQARAREARGEPLADVLARVAQPRELGAGQRGEVAREVRAPVAEPDDADRDAHEAGARSAAISLA
jgi:hypothetical protein